MNKKDRERFIEIEKGKEKYRQEREKERKC